LNFKIGFFLKFKNWWFWAAGGRIHSEKSLFDLNWDCILFLFKYSPGLKNVKSAAVDPWGSGIKTTLSPFCRVPYL